MKTDDIKTGELSATSTSTYILNGRCAQTMYKQTVEQRVVYSIYYMDTLVLPCIGERRGCL